MQGNTSVGETKTNTRNLHLAMYSNNCVLEQWISKLYLLVSSLIQNVLAKIRLKSLFERTSKDGIVIVARSVKDTTYLL